MSVLLTVEEAAERLHASPRFVRRLITERRIPFTRMGRLVRLSEADVDAFVASCRVEPLRPADVRRALGRR